MEKIEIGATGEFPQGKLNADDEGQLRMAITVKDDKLIIDFGKPVHWLGMNKEEARQFAELILNRIDD